MQNTAMLVTMYKIVQLVNRYLCSYELVAGFCCTILAPTNLNNIYISALATKFQCGHTIVVMSVYYSRHVGIL